MYFIKEKQKLKTKKATCMLPILKKKRKNITFSLKVKHFKEIYLKKLNKIIIQKLYVSYQIKIKIRKAFTNSNSIYQLLKNGKFLQLFINYRRKRIIKAFTNSNSNYQQLKREIVQLYIYQLQKRKDYIHNSTKKKCKHQPGMARKLPSN